ncbi:MAG: sensor histidine kinase [Planctomycetota bacterium]
MQNGRILLIEDCADEALVCERILTAEGYDVQFLQGDKAAREVLSSGNIDLLLLDLRLSNSDGMELLKWLKLESDVEVSTIVLTAFGEHKDHVKAIENGAVDVIRKPVDFAELKAKISIHMQLIQLRNELTVRNEELFRSNKKLETVLELKKQFLALITHDLRTPITTIKLAAEVLRDEVTRNISALGKKTGDLLNMLLRNILRVESNFNEIMIIANIDVGGLNLRYSPFDLNSIINDAIGICNPEITHKSIDITTDFTEISEIIADVKRIKQMVVNMITISLSRMDIKDKASIKTELVNNGVRITVTDTGPFLDKTYINELMHGLQSNLPTAQTRVGFYTSNQISISHGGEFRVESDIDAGTSQVAWIPLQPLNTN